MPPGGPHAPAHGCHARGSEGLSIALEELGLDDEVKTPLDLQAPELTRHARVVRWLERVGEPRAVQTGMSIPA